jgi:hypothetical protein
MTQSIQATAASNMLGIIVGSGNVTVSEEQLAAVDKTTMNDGLNKSGQSEVHLNSDHESSFVL